MKATCTTIITRPRPPPSRRCAALPTTDYFDPEDYITDGEDRDPYLGMFQPRIGFSYDLFGDRDTVLFGGYGRYYDRNVFNNTLDERFRLQYNTGDLLLLARRIAARREPDGGVRSALPDPRGLARIARDRCRPACPNCSRSRTMRRPPRTDQFSLGVRQRFGQWRASATGILYPRQERLHAPVRDAQGGNGDCCDTTVPNANGFANVLIGIDGLDTRYKALYLTLDKDYTKASGWGFGVAYTLSKSEQNGNDLFSLDKATPDDYGFRNKPGDERHRVVVNGILDLPAGFRVSTLSQFGSGAAFQMFDARNGDGINEREITSFFPRKTASRGYSLSVRSTSRVENEFTVYRGAKVNVAIDFLNLFNNKNYGGWDGFVGNRNFDITTDFLARNSALECSAVELADPAAANPASRGVPLLDLLSPAPLTAARA